MSKENLKFYQLVDDWKDTAAVYENTIKPDHTIWYGKKTDNSGLDRTKTLEWATADGETFYQLYDDGSGTAALYEVTKQADGTLSTKKLSDDSGISRKTIGLATADGETFYHLEDDGYGTAALWKSTLQSDGTFQSTKLNSDSGLSRTNTIGWSTADGNIFYQLFDDEYGTAALYENTIKSDGTIWYGKKSADSGLSRDKTIAWAAWDHSKPVNNAPDAQKDSVMVESGETISIDVLSNDTDPDGDTLTITQVADPIKGTAEIVDGKIKYTAAEGFVGTESFSYAISDGNGGHDTATIHVTVKDSNNAPDAQKDSVMVESGEMISIDVLSNDTDPDGDTLTITQVADPIKGTAEIVDGQIKYTAAEGFVGTESFSYAISDGNGGQDTATIHVTVKEPTPENHIPDAIDDHYTVMEGGDINLKDQPEKGLLSNDTDSDGDTLRIKAVNGTEFTGETLVEGDNGGKFTVLENGGFKFWAGEGFEDLNAGETRDTSITYTIDDGNGGMDTATVKVTVTGKDDVPGGNNAPDAVDDSNKTAVGQKVGTKVLENDTDPDGDPLRIKSFTQAANGTVKLNNNGTIDDKTDDKLVYFPDAGFTGTDTFTYTIADPSGLMDTATVTIHVGDDPGAGNNPPVAVDDTNKTVAGKKVGTKVLANDTDPDGDPLRIKSFTQAENGTVKRNNNGTPTDFSDDKLVYTPNEGFTGTDTFTYAVADPSGAMDMATVTIHVGGENNAPDAVDDYNSTNVGQKVGTKVLENDTDPDGDPLRIKSFTQAANGTVKLNNNGTINDKTDDKLVYFPNEGFTGTDTFTYTIADPSGAMDTATVKIDVIDPNPAPKITAELVGTTSIHEGDQGTYKIQLDNVTDRDRTFTIEVEDGTANRVDQNAANQDIIWGGFYDIRDGIGGEVLKVVYDRVPNSTRVSDGDRPAFGPGDASWDYTVYQDDSINTGNTITVTVPAGETMSNTFEVQAWKEMVTVDRDGPNARNFLENTENFSVKVVGTDDTMFSQDSLQVEILDKTHYGYVSPIVVDLNGDGIQTISIDEGVEFDIFNTGEKVNTGWLSGNDGFLAVDNNGNGLIENQDELFGGAGVGDAFEKLASFDSNNDGIVSALDDNFGQIMVWQDANENAVTDAGELQSLTAAGISELSLDYQSGFSLDPQGNVFGETSTAVVNGETRDLIDVYFEQL